MEDMFDVEEVICTEGKICAAKGSYTIELSLLMAVMIPLLVGIMYLGFFLHDRAFTQAAAYETAVYAGLHADEEMDAAAAARELISGRMLGTGNVEAQAESSRKNIKVRYQGNMRIPGMLVSLFGSGFLTIRSEAAAEVEAPSGRIQKIRGIYRIAETLERREE